MEIKTEKGTVFIPDYRNTGGLLDIKRMERIHEMKIKQEIMRKLEVLETAAGILNDLTEEQIKIFEECIKRNLSTSDEIELNKNKS